MSDRDASTTALATLYMRAAHRLLDAPPWILDDQVAVSLLGEAAAERIRTAAERYRAPAARALRAHVLLRSRFAEDRLALAVGRGVTQYVILGAGFDTFALRQPAWAEALTIFEIDQPATQARKISWLAERGLTVPPNVNFISADFERETLRDSLLRQGVLPDRPTFFSWLGVTMYLREEAIDTTLRAVAEFSGGSEIVFTFTQPPESMTGPVADFHSSLARLVAGIGEPFVSYFKPAEIAAKLHSCGFTKVAFLAPAEAEAKYFRQRPPDLPLSQRSAIVSAAL